MDGASKYDHDPEALAWARAKVMRDVERYELFAAEQPDRFPTSWASIAQHLRRDYIGGQGCIIAAFDDRLPDVLKATGEDVSW